MKKELTSKLSAQFVINSNYKGCKGSAKDFQLHFLLVRISTDRLLTIKIPDIPELLRNCIVVPLTFGFVIR
jgi:hypothetical protein